MPVLVQDLICLRAWTFSFADPFSARYSGVACNCCGGSVAVSRPPTLVSRGLCGCRRILCDIGVPDYVPFARVHCALRAGAVCGLFFAHAERHAVWDSHAPEWFPGRAGGRRRWRHRWCRSGWYALARTGGASPKKRTSSNGFRTYVVRYHIDGNQLRRNMD